MAAREQVKALFTTTAPKPVRKDKLTQTKLRERELKEAHRAEILTTKQNGMERRKELHLQVKEERTLHDTKRAAKDKREAARREAHAATGQMCEHGVWRCKLCFPHHDHKALRVGFAV